MIKDNQKNFSRLHMLIDVFVIAASYALAWLIRFQGIFEHSAVQSKTVQEYMFMLIFIIPGYVLLYQAFANFLYFLTLLIHISSFRNNLP